MLREKLWTMVDQYEKPFKVGLYLVVILLMAGIIWVRAAAPPDTISYQGYLTDASGTPVNSSVNMNIAFWDVATGGSSAYAEDHTNVTVSRGQFDLELGAGTPTSGTWGAVDFSQALWMEITVGGETFTPRIPLSAVPYARFAFQSQQIGTLTAGKWCASDGNVINCDQTAPTDEVGAVTNNKWCRGDGSAVQCDQTAPTDEVGTLTPNKWCTANAGGTAIDCTQDAPGGGGSYTTYTSSGSNRVTATCSTGTAVMGGCIADNPAICSIMENYPSIGGTALSGSQTPTSWTCYFYDTYLAQACSGTTKVTCQ